VATARKFKLSKPVITGIYHTHLEAYETCDTSNESGKITGLKTCDIIIPVFKSPVVISQYMSAFNIP
jgi:hypothetical protein